MRYVIIGNAGSGKSTLARRLRDTHKLPVLDLDTVYFEPDSPGVARPLQDVLADVRVFADAREGWIIEGCYGDVAERLLDLNPMLLFLDIPVDECVAHCRARPFEAHKFESLQAQAAQLEFLLDWVRAYPERAGPLGRDAHVAVHERHPGPRMRLVSQLAVAQFSG